MRFLVFLLLLPVFAGAQFRNESTDTSWKKIYRETPEKRHDLIHTKLDVKFDYNNSYLYGKEWLTLKPHFYEYDTVILDARGMIISKVAVAKGNVLTDLQYRYDGAKLHIKTDKTYRKNEKFTLYFEYTSRPNELKDKGSAAITSAKGLYFINPLGKTPNKPTQIWTQGETEANSAWMVTIDKPNQKTTQEISMTVPDKYVSLSNGLLVSSKKNTDGTRTDYWKQDLPHAPYLFFMGVGDFSVTKDKYKNKEVSYYVEKEYAPYARGIFGLTPEMMACYERLTGVDYPWAKYSQIVGRDFVSGAMENTTATLHQAAAQQNGRELADGNSWEETIAHELFHHWFGDLVTTESWSNITLNESFANYGEYLWLECKYGKDKADEHNFQDMGQYLMSGSDEKDLVRYHYADKEDVFDLVSYPKGGRILHMLRNHIGDSAFFKGINLYLTENRFKSAEVAQLRMAFEEVTGKDLNWYFNQWYFGSGHPELKINYEYDDAAGKAKVIVNQTQKSGKLFKLPVAVDVIEDGKKKRYMEWIDAMNDTLEFSYVKRPQLINVDADKVLLAEKTDNKTSENYQAQWKYAGNYMDRYEAINHFAKKNMPELAEGLRDPYDGIRQLTIQKLGSSAYKNDPVVLETMENLALSKSGGKVRAAAISFLVKNGDRKYAYIYEKAVNDSSYSVAGASLKGLMDMDPDNSYNLAKKYSSDAKGPLGRIVNETLMKKGKEEDFEFLAERYGDMPLSDEKISQTRPFINYLGTLKDENNIKKGIDKIMDMRSKVPEEYRSFIDPMLSRPLNDLGKSKGENIQKYVEEKMEEK